MPAGVALARVQRSSLPVKKPMVPWSPAVSISSQMVVARSAPSPAWRDAESVAELGDQLLGVHGRQAAEQAVRGKHQQAGVAHADAHHQHEVGRIVWLQLAGGGQFVAVVAGRFVAVVAVGDEQRLGGHQLDQLRDHRRIGDRPQAMDDAQVVGGFDRRNLLGGGFEQVLGGVGVVGKQAEDLAQVRPAGAGQQQAVLLGARKRLFVRVDVSLAEALQLQRTMKPRRVCFFPSASNSWW